MNRLHRWHCRSDRWRRVVQGQMVPWALHDVTVGDRVLELGSGHGLATDVLARRCSSVTAVEGDPVLADALQSRFAGTNVSVVAGAPTALPFDEGSFDRVLSFAVMHHIPSVELQDQMLAEARRVLRPGGVFAGADNLPSVAFRLAHARDAVVLVDPQTLGGRLRTAGLVQPYVAPAPGSIRFRALVPTVSFGDTPAARLASGGGRVLMAAPRGDVR